MDGLRCLGESGDSTNALSTVPYRIYCFSVFSSRWWFRKRFLAFPVHLFDATAARLWERPEYTPYGYSYTHFVEISIVFPGLFVNSKV